MLIGVSVPLRCYHLIVLWLPSLLFSGGNTSIDNNPKHDGDDGTSFLGPDGEPFLYPLKGNVEGFLAVFKNTH